MYMTNRDVEHTNPIIVIRDEEETGDGGIWSMMVNKKGTSDPYVSEKNAKQKSWKYRYVLCDKL